MTSFATISSRHMELLAAVVKNLKSTDVDWDTVATDANFKTSKYARDEYNKILKKLQAAGPPNKDKEGGATAEEDTPVAITATPKSKKRKAATEKTPTKAKKAKKSLAAVQAAEDEEVQVKPEPDEGEGEDEGEVVEARDEDAVF